MFKNKLQNNKYLLLLLYIILCCSFLLLSDKKTKAQNLENPNILKRLSSEDLIARDLFISIRRAGGPGNIISRDVYSRAVYQKSLLPEDKHIQNSPTATTNWVSVNPIGMFYARTGNNYVSGRTNSIAFHPTNPNIFYIGAAQGGIWKTTDGGVTWQALTDNLSTLSSGDIAIDQANPNILYYGTGEMNFSLDSHYGDGIFKSTDEGSTWTKIAAKTDVGSYISKIVIDPSNSGNIYSAGSSGIFKSTNGGLNWFNTFSPGGCTTLFIDPTNTQILYAPPVAPLEHQL